MTLIEIPAVFRVANFEKNYSTELSWRKIELSLEKIVLS
jgi:hypothetical protein